MLQLKTDQDYAENLNVHVHYLNHAVKEVTCKPTSAHISKRIINETEALMQHTYWNVSNIAIHQALNTRLVSTTILSK